MSKKNRIKGFILVETMVVIAFLATTLLTVYSSFTTVLDNAKTRIFYDDPIYLYRTYYFLSYLERNNITEFIDTKFANTSGTTSNTLSIVEFGCGALSVTEASGGSTDTGFCESLKSSMDINHVFIMNYNDIISNVVKKQFSQLLGAQPLGRPTREELIEITGNEEHYNHFISFQGFWTEGNSFSHVENVGISTVDSNVIDLGKDLAVYFHYNNNQLEIEAIYNANAIPPDAVAFLMKQFKNITSKLPACWNNTIEEMKEIIVNNYQNNDSLTHNQAMALGSILSKFPLFANIPVLRINNLITNAHIAELSRGEIVQQINLPQKNIAFVVSGKVLRYREASDGWLNPLNVLKPTNVINEFAILEPNSNIYAEVVSNTAVIVFLSVKNVQKLLDEIPQFGSNFSKHLLKELNKYQKRWMTV